MYSPDAPQLRFQTKTAARSVIGTGNKAAKKCLLHPLPCREDIQQQAASRQAPTPGPATKGQVKAPLLLAEFSAELGVPTCILTGLIPIAFVCLLFGLGP
ncbi:Protein of unknown function [Pyronema omphalodes CBS 100304]|uniref:Uncharacterized protein n=1 Tax=Pyronema omphalodes (strain CBS 100304) TaxID=1076935 RepID=U4L4J7_PYROM|nr:Protein of unknown function [Pyronema omphalodes CBS 100304]